MKILVLTISDRAARGIYEDLSGPAVEQMIRERISSADIKRDIVVDDKDKIVSAFVNHREYDCILTTGGTGLSDRDVTPEATEEFCDRLVPGIAELLRMRSYAQTPNAMLSRGVAGTKGKTLIVNLPGSVKGAAFCTQVLLDVLEHAIAMMQGKGH